MDKLILKLKEKFGEKKSILFIEELINRYNNH